MTSISGNQGVQTNWNAAAGDGRVTQQEASTIISAARLNAVSSTELKEAEGVLFETQRALAEHDTSGGAVRTALEVLTGGGSAGDAIEGGVSNAISGTRLREARDSAEQIKDGLQQTRDQQGFFTNLKADFTDWYKSFF
jgi:hypothetical protein